MYLCTLWMEGELYQPPLSVSPFLSMKMQKQDTHCQQEKIKNKKNQFNHLPKNERLSRPQYSFLSVDIPTRVYLCDG